jgi:hypothetical protein
VGAQPQTYLGIEERRFLNIEGPEDNDLEANVSIIDHGGPGEMTTGSGVRIDASARYTGSIVATRAHLASGYSGNGDHVVRVWSILLQKS